MKAQNYFSTLLIPNWGAKATQQFSSPGSARSASATNYQPPTLLLTTLSFKMAN